MKCKNCGFPKDAHTEAAEGARLVWRCPNGSGDTFPATIDVRVELHYRAGDRYPWIAKGINPTVGPWEVACEGPIQALETAGREIEKSREEKTPQEKEIASAIDETRHSGPR